MFLLSQSVYLLQSYNYHVAFIYNIIIKKYVFEIKGRAKFNKHLSKLAKTVSQMSS